MTLNKQDLHTAIELALIENLNTAIKAAEQAHSAATDEENKAENKYDTLGLEASYLAAGQSRRVAQCEEEISTFKKLKAKQFSSETEIQLGALVCLSTDNKQQKYVFLSPVGGGVSLNYDGKHIMLVTLSSPLGKCLYQAFEGDDISIEQNNQITRYEIESIV